MRVPGLECVNGGIVERGEAVSQIERPRTEGKLDDDGTIFHPGQRDAVIKFADVAKQSGCEKGERGRWKKVANFHWGEFAKSAGNYVKKNF